MRRATGVAPQFSILFNIMVRQLPLVCSTEVFQFADDLTNSTSANDPNQLSAKLQDNYSKIKAFCSNIGLEINLNKTQLIIFKSAAKKLPPNFVISLDNVPISPSQTVKLLGVTLDQHFTMGSHIDGVVKKCHGLLGMLRRSTAYLPRELLNLVYTSVIRSHLEYCSGTFFNAAPTHLNKLDVVQKIASRIITGSSPQAHSAPLQLQLGLDLLQSRRKIHVVSLVIDILRGQSHPYLIELFQSSAMSNCTTIPNNKLAIRGSLGLELKSTTNISAAL